MDTVQKINDILVSLFNTVLKLEEKALKESTTHNLSITEMHTLVAIGEGRPKTMSQVAGALKINVSTLTVAINKLLAKGYVSRFRVAEDRRIVKIELTEMGVAAVREHEAFHVAMVSDAIAGLSREEAERFADSIHNLNEFMEMKRVMTLKSDAPVSFSPIKLGELIVPVPIFQGGMGIGISLNRLAAAVAKCGGVGVISAAQPGFLEADFDTNALEANLRAMKREIKKALAEAATVENPGPIGVNIMVASQNYEAFVKAAIEAGAQVIVSGAGLPTSLPGMCKGSDVKLIPIVSSARAAGIIIKNWAKKYNRAPDAVLFEGPLAGGHLGFKEAQLDVAREDFYKTIAQIKGEMDGLAGCPLIVAGGIYTKADAEKAMAFGADAVQLGTRFVVTEECDAPDSFKQAYIDAGQEDVTIIKSPVGMPGRALNNAFVKRVAQNPIPIEKCNNCLITCNPKDAPYCITQALATAAQGDVDNGLVFCGSNVYKARKIEKVADIFEEFTS